LQNDIGQTFKGEIQGIEEFGVFISVSSSTVALADGLVHLRDIPGDYYVYNEAKGILVGRRTGKSFKRGDKITVRLINVNPVKGENDFEIVGNKWKEEGRDRKEKRQRKRRFGR
jgi:ribonuclease R